MRKLLLITLATIALNAQQACRSGEASQPGNPSESASARAMFHGDAGHSGVYAGAAPRRFEEVLWTFQTEGPVRSSPAVTVVTVYIGSGDHQLYALDRRSGEPRWMFTTAGPVDSSPAVDAGIVYVTSRDDHLYAIDAVSGAQRWRFQTGDTLPLEWGWDYFLSSPVVAGGLVYFGGGDGFLYALTTANGKEKWRFKTAGRVSSSPAVRDGKVYVGSTDGSVYAVDALTGDEVWKFDPEGTRLDSSAFGFDRRSVTSSPAVVDGTVVIGSRDGHLYALDAADGSERWRYEYEMYSWGIATPVVHDGHVLTGTSDGHLFHALDLMNGQEVWRFPTPQAVHSSAALAGGVVTFGCQDGFVYALDSQSGGEQWRFRVGATVLSSPAVVGGVVYVGADDGRVYALAGDSEPRAEVETLRVVFWQKFAFSWRRDHEEVRDYFAAEGYDVLDGATLAAFMNERIADGAPSTVVFAADQVPAEIGLEPSPDTLLRRYLDAGGKVVWMGLAPFAAVLGEDERPTDIDLKRPTPLLGVDFSYDRYDFYGARPTTEGKSWGLEGWWMGRGGVLAAEVDTVLAADAEGRASAWVRRFSADGGGFVYLSAARELPFDLALVKAVAEYR